MDAMPCQPLPEVEYAAVTGTGARPEEASCDDSQ
jgi:hypothetical protein